MLDLRFEQLTEFNLKYWKQHNGFKSYKHIHELEYTHVLALELLRLSM